MNVIDREEFAQLLRENSIKLRLKREVRFVPEEIEEWDSRDFLAVTNRSGSEGILIAPLEAMYVVPFQLHKRMPSSRSGRTEAIICDFCATWQRGSNSATITFFKKSSTISFLCCADLLCSLHVRSKTLAATLSRTQLREDITAEGRISRLRARLTAILDQMSD
ncbi:MAG TPA: FBP domain-containing protein [Candidatus Saccharimonadales bacterium]|nr:FBP domain-containing protein [Candidatus Saccharimonadales bacterium]